MKVVDIIKKHWAGDVKVSERMGYDSFAPDYFTIKLYDGEGDEISYIYYYPQKRRLEFTRGVPEVFYFLRDIRKDLETEGFSVSVSDCPLDWLPLVRMEVEFETRKALDHLPYGRVFSLGVTSLYSQVTWVKIPDEKRMVSEESCRDIMRIVEMDPKFERIRPWYEKNLLDLDLSSFFCRLAEVFFANVYDCSLVIDLDKLRPMGV